MIPISFQSPPQATLLASSTVAGRQPRARALHRRVSSGAAGAQLCVPRLRGLLGSQRAGARPQKGAVKLLEEAAKPEEGRKEEQRETCRGRSTFFFDKCMGLEEQVPQSCRARGRSPSAVLGLALAEGHRQLASLSSLKPCCLASPGPPVT